MAAVLKISNPEDNHASDGMLRSITMIRKNDGDVALGTSVFLWSHYSAPQIADGHLFAVGVCIGFERSEDLKSATITVAISNRRPPSVWRTQELDALKNRNDGSPATEIADQVRGFTHDHVGHVSPDAAALMAARFT